MGGDRTRQCTSRQLAATGAPGDLPGAVFRYYVLADHPAPWWHLRAQRAAAPSQLKSFDQNKVQESLCRTPCCKPTVACALNSCRVVFVTARTVVDRHNLLLGEAPGRPQTRFAFLFVDEAARQSIAVGLDFAAIGNQNLLCGDRGQLGP